MLFPHHATHNVREHGADDREPLSIDAKRPKALDNQAFNIAQINNGLKAEPRCFVPVPCKKGSQRRGRSKTPGNAVLYRSDEDVRAVPQPAVEGCH
ncbi:hypothetical protein [uncultured Agrobacterium sp.]|uniref:hypothetical protein n=1 Tax=uncultured Agrobacterium sp. TaxID=157277 RepID=UPI0025D75538|nr:hypothetical protein [uncultured Agrobacterium sp.]